MDRWFIKITFAARGLNYDNFYKCKARINYYYSLYNDKFIKLIDKKFDNKKGYRYVNTKIQLTYH